MIETGKYYKLEYNGIAPYTTIYFYVVKAKNMINNRQRAVIIYQERPRPNEIKDKVTIQDIVITFPINPKEIYTELTADEFLQLINGADKWKEDYSEHTGV